MIVMVNIITLLFLNKLNFYKFTHYIPSGKFIFKQDEKQLIETLRRKIYGVTRNIMTPSSLTEKNWFVK